MSEKSRQLEVRPGDTVFISMSRDGETHMHYLAGGDYQTLDSMCSAFEQFLRGSGFTFDGHMDFVDDEGESEWAVSVRNFLDSLTNPETFGHAVSEEVVREAARLRDA